MSQPARPTPSRGSILLQSFLVALAAGAGAFAVSLFTGFDPLWSPISAAVVVVVLTGIFYAINARRASRAGSPSTER